MLARSVLYVPGDAPDKLARALERGADETIVDLEDAVPVRRKAYARSAVREWLASVADKRTRIWVRINPGETMVEDVSALEGVDGLGGVVLAKTESRADLELLDGLLRRAGSSAAIQPLLESAVAIARVEEIVTGPRVSRLQVGEVDLQADVGIEPSSDEREMLHHRSAVVFASAAAGIAPPIAPASTQLRDLEAFRTSTERLARLGFVGRACIHPAQVAVANEVFIKPSAEEVTRAQTMLDRFAEEIGIDQDGQFVDEAVLRQARMILARAKR